MAYIHSETECIADRLHFLQSCIMNNQYCEDYGYCFKQVCDTELSCSTTVLVMQNISSVMLMFTGMFLLLNKKFNKHPFKFIAIITLLEAAWFQDCNAQLILCKWDSFSKLFEYTLNSFEFIFTS